MVLGSFLELGKADMMEVCDNALDDDMDGLIDLNDPDCSCDIFAPKSLIPNPSFEDQLCCPHSRSQLDCAEGWIQASEPTTDYIHTCNWLGWDQFPPPQPFPDGEGIMGFRDGRTGGPEDDNNQPNWKEYAGACLLRPLIKDITYRFEFHLGFTKDASPSIDISFYGTTDCAYLPFGVNRDDFGCPTNGDNWRLLGNRFVTHHSGNSANWKLITIEITPSEDIHAIAIGPPCRATNSTSSTYYFFDNLILADLKTFEFQISEINHPCDEQFVLTMPDDPNFSYQWYKDGIALVGERAHSLTKMYGEGEYQVRFLNEDLCRLTNPYPYYIPYASSNPKVGICALESYIFGDKELTSTGMYMDTFKTVNNCDSIVTLDLTVQRETPDTVGAKIFKGERFEDIPNYNFSEEGDYLASITSSIGCDSLIFLELGYYQVYIPNIFSPNGDGVNDRFTIQGGQDLVEIEELSIFDRWGNRVFRSTNEFENDGNGWDGYYKSNPALSGLYVYHCVLIMDDNKRHTMSGSVFLSQ